MTREEAIEKLHWFALDNRDKQIIDMAIEALTSQNLTKPNNTCEVDLISRADAVKAICDKCLEEHCETECIVPCTFMEALEAVPSSEAVPLRRDCTECALRAINRPKLDEESYERGYTAGQFADRPNGKWVEVEDYNGDIHYKCDQCGEEWTFPYGTPKENNANFCPNCGARMKGGDTE